MSVAQDSHYRVVDVEGTGADARLVMGTRPLPTVSADDILVRVHAAGVNRADLLQRQGLYPPPAGASDVMGLELAGEVVQVGSDVRRFREGDKVCAILSGGGYGAYCLVPQFQAAPIVEGLNWQENAVVPEVWCTVWSMIMDRGRLQEHESLLVHGGSGGIGCAAIQLGGLYGKRVFATARGKAKRAYCQALSNKDTLRVIDYEEEDFVAVVRKRRRGGALM